MKTISTLFVSLFAGISVFAADTKPASMLTIKSAAPGTIRVIVDGKSFEPGNNTVMIDHVNAGYHSISVYRTRESGFFKSTGRASKMIYNSSLAVNPGTSVVIGIDRFGRADITEQKLGGTGYEDYNDRDGRTGRIDNGRWEDNSSYSGYARAMTDPEFNQVMSSMQKEWFESNKLKSASYMISSNFFTADQVKDMMSLFSMESNKLEIAKQAYSKTLDKQNYRCVSDALSFGNSRRELALFMGE